MKSIVLRTAGFVVAVLLASGVFFRVSAQPGRGQFRGEGRPANESHLEKIKLTEDQQKQMTGLRAQFQDETGKINNLIREKEAHLKTLADTENRDMKDLDKTVAELTTLKGDLIKKGIAYTFRNQYFNQLLHNLQERENLWNNHLWWFISCWQYF